MMHHKAALLSVMRFHNSMVLFISLAIAFALSATTPAQTAPKARPELVLQTGHTDGVNAIALSPDGRFLVSASDDTTLKLWEISSANVLRTLYGHDKPVLCLAVSPDSKLIASGSEDTTVRIWDVVTGKPRTLGGHSTPVKEIAFSADGRQLTSLGAFELKLWDVASGGEIRTTKLVDDKSRNQAMMIGTAGRSDQTAAALTSDGRLGAIGGGFTYKNGVLGYGGGLRTKPIRIIEAATGREVESFKLKGDLPSPTDLTFSPDGKLLIAKFTDSVAARTRAAQSTLLVYDVATAREVKKFPAGDPYGIGGTAFSPDGKVLASRIFTSSATPPTDPNAIGDYASGSIKLLDVSSWQELRELKKTGFEMDFNRGLSPSPLCFSSDGKIVAASLGQGVALFDTATGTKLRELKTTERQSAVTAAPPSAQPSRDQMMRQAGMDPELMRQVQEILGSMTGANSPLSAVERGLGIRTSSPINFSPDGRVLVSSESSTVWDVSAGTPRARSVAQRGLYSALGGAAAEGVYSPDGKLSAVVSHDNSGLTILIKDTASGKVVRTIAVARNTPGPANTSIPPQVSGVAFGPRGVVVHYHDFKMSSRGILGGGGGSQESHVKTFDPNTGQELRDLRLEDGKDMFSGFGNQSVLSPDGRFIVSLVAETPGGGFAGLRPSFPGLGRRGGSAPKSSYKVRLADTDAGRRLWEFKVETENMSALPNFVFNSTSSVLAITSLEKNQPVINLHDVSTGRKIASLDAGVEKISSMTFSKDGKLLAITYGDPQASMMGGRGRTSRGGENLVSVWDCTSGRQLYVLTHETAVSGAAFSPSGKVIATLGQDRNEYLWDAQSGEKLATLVNLDMLNIFGGGAEWLVVTPDGLFDGSPAAWQQIMWRFSDNTFDVGPVEIFFNELYYPGLAGEIFSGKRPKAPRDIQRLDRRQPKVKITTNQAPTGEVNARTVTLSVDVTEAPADSAHPRGSGAQDVRLFRNGTMVKLWRGDVLDGRQQRTLEASIPIVAGENRFTAYAFNRDNVKSSDAFLSLVGSASLQRKGTAYVLAFGVNQYANEQYNLKYAGADAVDFADEVRAEQSKLGDYASVEVVSLLDKDATKSNLLTALKLLAGTVDISSAPAALAKLKQAEPEDTVVVYFAGHGTAKGARFYLVPHDLGYTGSRSAIDAEAVDSILKHSVSDLELEQAVEGLDAGQMVFVIDACNSGQALEAEEKRRGPMNSKGLAQLAYEKGIYILTAAQSYQAALEASQLGHGYLTYALVEEGLKKSAADREQKDGQILVREWFNFATERVPEMQEQNTGSRLLLEEDEKSKDASRVRNLQRPRAFYRREGESRPLVIARP